ncbi:flagellar biosynthesis protein FlaG [Alteromonas sp. 345S023]|uniref:Flagellar biosynthesis protein FlaG n=1 Tax=Alteromonas profundi TaxID=2696062 RepID=A0A7X5RJP2_9ALTE|nr:flagellar biosynthesis protein FlaG [Alteromonas profundi]
MEIQHSAFAQSTTLPEQQHKNTSIETNKDVAGIARHSDTTGESSSQKNSVNLVKELEESADSTTNSGSFELEEAVKKVESFLSSQNRDLSFTIDDETKRTIVTVKESSSGEVIRQIPSEEVLNLASRIRELQDDVGNSVGVFINSEI